MTPATFEIIAAKAPAARTVIVDVDVEGRRCRTWEIEPYVVSDGMTATAADLLPCRGR